MRLVTWLFVVTGLLGSPSSGHAQAGEDTEQRWERTGLGGIGGLRYSVPFKLSIYGGVSRAGFNGCNYYPTPESERCIFAFHRVGVVGEIGAAGGQVSVTRGFGASHPVPVALRGQLSVMRTWRHPLVATANETYLGAEIRAALLIGVGIGVFRRISEGESDRWLVLGGIHLGG